MKRVQVLANKIDESYLEQLDATFDASELELLSSFSEYLKRVRHSSILDRGMPAIQNVNFSEASGLTLSCAPYLNSELYELLHVLRPVILKNEPASFHNVRALINRRLKSKELGAYLKVQLQLFEHGELSFFMQISIEDQPLFHESLLRLWLNADQYHTDPEKVALWRELESTLQAENTRALVMNQLHGIVKALFNLDYVVKLVITASHGT